MRGLELQPVAIVGAGGHAREVVDILDASNGSRPTFEILGHIVEPGFGQAGEIVNGRPILGGFEWFAGRESQVKTICAVGAPALRRRLVAQTRDAGVRFFSCVHPDASLTKWVTLGEGVVIAAGCVFTNQVRVGSHVHVNVGCTVSHNTTLEDFVTLAPGVHCAGNSLFREGCDVGIGASILPKIEIGAWSVIGAGAAVIRNVPPNSTVVGVPAKVRSTRAVGWQLR